MDRTQLLAEKEELLIQLAIVNTTIKNVLARNNKEYSYSNVESSHKATTHTLKELREMKKAILDELARINRLLGCVVLFTQMKN